MKTILLLILFLSGTLLTLHADVFSLWPFGKDNSGVQSANGSGDISTLLNPKKFLDEKLQINGTELELTISLVDLSLSDALSVLRKQFPGMSFAANSNSVLMEQKLGNGFIRRIYLLELDGIYSLLQFSMDVPEKNGEATSALWPKELPLPPGAQNLTVMRFPKRNAVYGAFASPYTKDQVLNDLTLSLKNEHWIPLTGEAGNPYSGNGEIFMRESPMALMMIGVQSTDRNGTRATLYMRPIK